MGAIQNALMLYASYTQPPSHTEFIMHVFVFLSLSFCFFSSLACSYSLSLSVNIYKFLVGSLVGERKGIMAGICYTFAVATKYQALITVNNFNRATTYANALSLIRCVYEFH